MKYNTKITPLWTRLQKCYRSTLHSARFLNVVSWGEKTNIFVPPSFFLSMTLTKTPLLPRGGCCLSAMEGDSYSFHPSACKTRIKTTACVCIWKPSKRGWYWWWFLSVALHICISWNFSVHIELKSLSSLFWSQWNSCLPVLIHLFMRFYFCLPLPTRHAWPACWACALAPAFSPCKVTEPSLFSSSCKVVL